MSGFVRDNTLAALNLSQLPVPTIVIPHGSEPAEGFSRIGTTDTIRIVVVGVLTQQKQIHLYPELVEVMRSSGVERPLSITFFGRGPLETVVRTLETESTPDISVRYGGYANNLADVFGHADLHLILARDEAFGMVVTEAMAWGVPTVAIRSGAFPQIITDGEDGLIVEDVAHAAAVLSTMDFERLRWLGDAANRTFRRRFTNERSLAETVEFIERVIRTVN